tara:strand:+ start:2258 stop:2743 length:486 start_codon:yes stop_codon:yes gene_type:complete
MLLCRKFGLFLIILLITSCGFQLRVAKNLPIEMDRTYISTEDEYSIFYRQLKKGLYERGVEVVESPVDATAVFNILQEDTGQRVLSVSGRNVVREYEVFYRVFYSIQTKDKLIKSPQEEILTRDYTYDETLVLGKEREENLLREAIADDLVRIILMQLVSL